MRRRLGIIFNHCSTFEGFSMLRLKGKPSEQVALVNTMQPSTAAAMCRWLIDPSFWGLASNVTQH
jgi:hypothetical protein